MNDTTMLHISANSYRTFKTNQLYNFLQYTLVSSQSFSLKKIIGFSLFCNMYNNSIMTRWRNYFSQLLNVHGAKEVRQAQIHTAEPLVPEPSDFEVELAIEK